MDRIKLPGPLPILRHGLGSPNSRHLTIKPKMSHNDLLAPRSGEDGEDGVSDIHVQKVCTAPFVDKKVCPTIFHSTEYSFGD